ncbi:hypothetical protein KDA08_05975 [Candidatus Saccharibacteria bacterium]|nr:hypothetical protein [Candidatus Saccharibacteria bacterium]
MSKIILDEEQESKVLEIIDANWSEENTAERPGIDSVIIYLENILDGNLEDEVKLALEIYAGVEG